MEKKLLKKKIVFPYLGENDQGKMSVWKSDKHNLKKIKSQVGEFYYSKKCERYDNSNLTFLKHKIEKSRVKIK